MVFANLKRSSGKSHGEITEKYRPLNSPRKHTLSFYCGVLTVLKQPNPNWDVASCHTGLFPLGLPEYRNFDHFLKLFSTRNESVCTNVSKIVNFGRGFKRRISYIMPCHLGGEHLQINYPFQTWK